MSDTPTDFEQHVSADNPTADAAQGAPDLQSELLKQLDDADPAETPAADVPDAQAAEESPTSSEPDAETESKAEAETPETDTEATDVDLSEDPTEAELTASKPSTRKRIEQLLKQRNEARVQAEQAAPIVDFMRENDIPQQDVDVVLQMSAMLSKGDFNGFLQAVQPFVDVAMQVTGRALPPDLQREVQAGKITQQHAQRLAQLQAQSKVTEQHQARQTAKLRDEAAAARATAVQSAVLQWEERTKATDPDYASMAEQIEGQVLRFIQQRGAPSSPQVAVQYAQEAYDAVKAFRDQYRPAMQQTKPNPTEAGPAATEAVVPAPKTPQEAMERALG